MQTYKSETSYEKLFTTCEVRPKPTSLDFQSGEIRPKSKTLDFQASEMRPKIRRQTLCHRLIYSADEAPSLNLHKVRAKTHTLDPNRFIHKLIGR